MEGIGIDQVFIKTPLLKLNIMEDVLAGSPL